MNYGLMSVKEACETLYAVGYTEIMLDDFVDLFCKKFELDRDVEYSRISNMLRVLEKQQIIEMLDDVILLWNMLSSNLRIRIT